MARQDNHFAFIEALRGSAALVVFYFHLHLHVFLHYPAQPIEPYSFTYWFILGAFDLGKFGVAVFFIVSGFLIPATLDRPGTRIRSFAVQRLFRLYPAFWISLLVYVAVEFLLYPAWTFTWRDYAINLTLLHGFVGVGDLIGGTWTLQIELIFYVLCGGLFVLGRFWRREWWIVYSLTAAFLCAGLRFYLGRKLPVAIFLALTLMFWGDLVRRAADDPTRRPLIVRFALLIGAALIPTSLLGYQEEAGRYIVTYLAALATFGLAFTYRQAIADSRWQPLFGVLANCSYSVYLLHGSLGLRVAADLLERGWQPLQAALAVVPLTLAASYATFRWVEQPCIRLGKRLTQTPAAEAKPRRLAA